MATEQQNKIIKGLVDKSGGIVRDTDITFITK